MANLYRTLSSGIGSDPAAAYSGTAGYWVGKVRPKGAWDYKTVPGYTPYNKLWTARVKNGTEFRTSEWFGNYNYGFTGKELFSLSMLFAGGDGAGILFGNGPDNEEDKASIRQGYNESP
ncbi:polymorphic toxin type 44 domain-containing protein [Paenibacillus medicaginis]|uniref:Polymorphic toxin type 44 domain-containing protein n=1 Tax=Paenibacillus medicaginis TaxID=1470560 RepID=A0ABV5BWB7_9BACL